MSIVSLVKLALVFSSVMSLLFVGLIVSAEDAFDVWLGAFGIAACTISLVGVTLLLKSHHKAAWILSYSGYALLVPIGIIPILALNKARESEAERRASSPDRLNSDHD